MSLVTATAFAGVDNRNRVGRLAVALGTQHLLIDARPSVSFQSQIVEV
jgi:hypothetical protein